jgi:[phosphatase 2A protein]-leucine-carboxy methyltransferase
MSAPQIPHLNTLRRGAGRGRGRGRSSPADAAAGQNVPHIDKDKIIQRTDFDAATSRLSAVECGYLDDPFAKPILPGGRAERRLPLMNRGALTAFSQYSRCSAIDECGRNVGSHNSH